jgi:hypothetical protein
MAENPSRRAKVHSRAQVGSSTLASAVEGFIPIKRM